jgi:hypothetical protein
VISTGFNDVPGGVLSVKAVVDLQFYPIAGFIVPEEYGFGFRAIR